MEPVLLRGFAGVVWTVIKFYFSFSGIGFKGKKYENRARFVSFHFNYISHLGYCGVRHWSESA